MNKLLERFPFPSKGVALLAVLLITAAAYAPSLGNQLTNWDDRTHIVDCVEIRGLDLDHLKAIFTSTTGRGYQPLTALSFALEYHFFKLDPFVYHLDNLLLHLLLTALVFWLALRLGLGVMAASFAGLFFGIHPMHVESVAWAVERKDVLYGTFYLLAMHAHLSYLDSGRKQMFALAMLCGLLSMLAKAMALSLPLILLLLDGMKQRRISLSVIGEKLWHVLYIFPLTWVTMSFYPHERVSNFSEGFLTFFWSVAFYLWKLFWPVVLNPLYERPEPVALTNPVYPAALLTVAAAGALLWVFRRNRWVMFAAMFYLFSLFYLFRTQVSQYTVVADRYMYLASIGVCCWLGYAVEEGFKRCSKHSLSSWAMIIGLVVLTGMLAIKTSLQCRVWKDSFSVWNEMIRANPDHWFGFYNRGRAYEYAGDDVRALEDYARAIELNPDFVSSYNNRAAIYIRSNRLDLALADLKAAEAVAPGVAEIYSNRAIILMRRKQYPEALRDLSQALEIRPDFMQALTNRGVTYANLNRLDLALADYDRALALDPSKAAIYFYRSLARADLGRWSEAVSDALKARELGYPGMDDYLRQLQDRRMSP